MNDLGIGAEFGEVAGDAIVEAGAEGQQHVALVHRHVGLVRAMHPEHADEQWIVGRVCAETH